MANIYTKTGDKGDTSLFGGTRVQKNSLRVDCYGTIDEANSTLGLACSKTSIKDIKEDIRKIQEKLFVVGAELASDQKGIHMLEGKITEEDIVYLENIIDKCVNVVGKQTKFIVPGVNEASSAMHMARTIIRRAERRIIQLRDQDSVRPELLKYINRLSDAIYALARLEETYFQIESIKKKAIEIIRENFQLGEGEKDSMEFNLDNIKKMAEFAQEKAREMNLSIVFSAVDSGGNLILFHRMEDSLLASIDISINKAFTASALKTATHDLVQISSPNNPLYGIQTTNNGRIVAIGGGFPYNYNGKVVGGIGISGGTVEEDMEVGMYVLERIKKGRS
ncbi:cob(I)yrinic acid a,c-diamide adenosyltransferase [Tissierella sp. MSJ-40]|uniref:Corrinoid adenosyltransferase n=1 Tax=Tissierella simiarum TaxID=2841534 RepID=A0ABS6E3Q6_9FIRM|nr:cob(I)yrinic acid a,c-diamide adenosyltransferase [Tissierella simiarum]MBU5437540.1 cob(I)yrinic acid a,c-diamide adenosyltransferase [Tissierella simiarum]